MTEHVKALQGTRQGMVNDRHDLAKVLAEAYDPAKRPLSQTTLIGVQSVIDKWIGRLRTSGRSRHRFRQKNFPPMIPTVTGINGSTAGKEN